MNTGIWYLISVIAAALLSIFTAYIYEKLKEKKIFPDKITWTRAVAIGVFLVALIILIALPQLITPSPGNAGSFQTGVEATRQAIDLELIDIQRKIATTQSDIATSQADIATAQAGGQASIATATTVVVDATATANNSKLIRLEATAAALSIIATQLAVSTPVVTNTATTFAPTSSATPAAIKTADPSPSVFPPTRQSINLSQPFFDDFESISFWNQFSDAYGKAQYLKGGYETTLFAKAPQSMGSWGDVLPGRVFHEGSLEVDVTPVTDPSFTGYVVGVGWRRGNTMVGFIVQSDGYCGFAEFNQGKGSPTTVARQCPPVTRGAAYRVKIIIKDKLLSAYVNDQLADSEEFINYRPGQIQLGVYNSDNSIMRKDATVRFDNLQILPTK